MAKSSNRGTQLISFVAEVAPDQKDEIAVTAAPAATTPAF